MALFVSQMLDFIKKDIEYDVVFIIRESDNIVEVQAHSKYLTYMSKEFGTMFNEIWKTSQIAIRQPVFSAKSFATFLASFYEIEPKLVDVDFAELLYLCEMYNIAILKESVCQKMISECTKETLTAALINIQLFNCKPSSDMKFTEEITRNLDEIFQSFDYLDLKWEEMDLLMLIAHQSGATAYELCDGIVSWAIHQCFVNGEDSTRPNMKRYYRSSLQYVRPKFGYRNDDEILIMVSARRNSDLNE